MKKLFVCMLSIICLAAFVFAGCSPDAPVQSDGAHHTVTFDSRGGTAVESQQVLDGNTVRRPETPARDGYFLNGWYTDAAASDGEWHFETDRVTSDLTLYAGWTLQSDLTPTASLVFELNDEGDGYTVTDVGEETQIVIPAEYNGLPVTSIQGHYGTGAFARTAVTIAYIPDSIEVIGQNTFHNCSDLVSVVISASSHLTAIGNNAFSGCSSLRSFYLPTGAESIGSGAFNNCGAIEQFTVAEGNAAYRSENGHLIDSATDTLIRGGHNPIVPDGVTAIAQAAFRRISGITELYIPVSVRSIGNYLIADSTITAVLFQGTEAEWNAIEKSDMWNHGNSEVTVEYSAEVPVGGSEILVVYFSATGNTESVAEYIAEAAGGTLCEIVPEVPYTAADLNYSDSACRANREQNDPDARPAIANEIDCFADYERILIGHPIWWGDAPRIIQTFRESYSFEEKTVYTFSTSGSSSGNGAYNGLRSEYPDINFAGNLHLTSSQLSSAQARVAEWLSEIGII